ncbi:hypothetical protein Hanom_Chr06g00537591 [Helianthus anomalus]
MMYIYSGVCNPITMLIFGNCLLNGGARCLGGGGSWWDVVGGQRWRRLLEAVEGGGSGEWRWWRV